MSSLDTLPNRRLQREGINRFLNDLYKQERLLSHMLSDAGLSPQEIAAVRSRINDYLDGLAQEWTRWFREILPDRDPDILIRRYSLDGKPPSTLEELGSEYNVTRERIRQLQIRALRRLRSPKRKQRLEEIAASEAHKLIGNRTLTRA